MSKPTKSSKRQSLRFTAEGFHFRYKTEFEEGGGVLANISGGGCAVRDLSVPLALQEKVLLILPVEDGEEAVEIGARVIRVDGSITALIFEQIGEVNKQRLIRFFARRQRSG